MSPGVTVTTGPGYVNTPAPTFAWMTWGYALRGARQIAGDTGYRYRVYERDGWWVAAPMPMTVQEWRAASDFVVSARRRYVAETTPRLRREVEA